MRNSSVEKHHKKIGDQIIEILDVANKDSWHDVLVAIKYPAAPVNGAQLVWTKVMKFLYNQVGASWSGSFHSPFDTPEQNGYLYLRKDTNHISLTADPRIVGGSSDTRDTFIFDAIHIIEYDKTGKEFRVVTHSCCRFIDVLPKPIDNHPDPEMGKWTHVVVNDPEENQMVIAYWNICEPRMALAIYKDLHFWEYDRVGNDSGLLSAVKFWTPAIDHTPTGNFNTPPPELKGVKE